MSTTQITFPAIPQLPTSATPATTEARTSGWFWSLGDATLPGPCIRSLLDGHGAGVPGLQRSLVRLVKTGRDTDLPDGTPLSKLVYGHLLQALQEDSHCLTVDLWGIYPGHTGDTPVLPILSRYLRQDGPLAEDRYLPHLLMRHTPAVKVAYARRRGTGVGFTNQANTVHLNPRYRELLKGRRVLILDDFCTQGYSFEWARHLLMQAGAAKAICISLGRCGRTYLRQRLVTNRRCDPFSSISYRDEDFLADPVTLAPSYPNLQQFRSDFLSHSAVTH